MFRLQVGAVPSMILELQLALLNRQVESLDGGCGRFGIALAELVLSVRQPRIRLTYDVHVQDLIFGRIQRSRREDIIRQTSEPK